MSVSFYTAKTGVIQSQQALDVTSNNIANVSTSGFKPLRPSFSDLIYTVRHADNEDTETGHGAKMEKTDLMYDAGGLTQTARELDFAIVGEGTFAIQQTDGDVVYSKNGSFQIQENDGAWNLIDAQGGKVLDYTGNPVVLAYNEDGTVDSAKLKNDIGVFIFENPYGLDPEGNNYFIATDSSGEAAADLVMEKKSGYLEASSSNLADQMVKVIQYQKAFSFNAKMVQTADQLENIINNLR